MKRAGLALLLLFLAFPGLLRADQTTSAVQRALKEQGFYYGDVSGQKTAETTAAIRRYQIRNGLQITGEIDAETLRSLGVGSGAARSRGRTGPAAVAESDPGEDEAPTQSAEIEPPARPNDYPAARQPGPSYRSSPIRPEGTTYGVLAGTPYEMAPPDLQRRVVVGTQTLLSRYGYYRSGIDGIFGPGTAAAVRIFQAQAGLRPNGRLNMETLSALGLLPGQRAPAVPLPSRRFRGRPVYRGELVPGR